MPTDLTPAGGNRRFTRHKQKPKHFLKGSAQKHLLKRSAQKHFLKRSAQKQFLEPSAQKTNRKMCEPAVKAMTDYRTVMEDVTCAD